MFNSSLGIAVRHLHNTIAAGGWICRGRIRTYCANRDEPNKKILVKRGDRITQNQKLAVLEKCDVEIQIAEAKASLAQAKSQLANLQQGKRPAEMAVIEASLESAIAQAAEAERIKKRQGLLLIKGIATKANFDDASTKFELARTKAVEIEATLTAARLSGFVEAVYLKNPGLAAFGPLIPIGTTIIIPDQNTVTTPPVNRLWG